MKILSALSKGDRLMLTVSEIDIDLSFKDFVLLSFGEEVRGQGFEVTEYNVLQQSFTLREVSFHGLGNSIILLKKIHGLPVTLSKVIDINTIVKLRQKAAQC